MIFHVYICILSLISCVPICRGALSFSPSHIIIRPHNTCKRVQHIHTYSLSLFSYQRKETKIEREFFHLRAIRIPNPIQYTFYNIVHWFVIRYWALTESASLFYRPVFLESIKREPNKTIEDINIYLYTYSSQTASQSHTSWVHI